MSRFVKSNGILVFLFIIPVLVYSYTLETGFNPADYILTEGFVHESPGVRMIIPSDWIYLSDISPEALVRFKSSDGRITGVLYTRPNEQPNTSLSRLFEELLSYQSEYEEHLWYCKKAFGSEGYLAKHQFRNYTYLYRALLTNASGDTLYYLKIGLRRPTDFNEDLETRLENDVLGVFYSLSVDTDSEMTARSYLGIRMIAPEFWSFQSADTDIIGHLYHEPLHILITVRYIDRIREGELVVSRVKDLINRFKARHTSDELEYQAEMVEITKQGIRAVHLHIMGISSSNGINIIMDKYFFIHRQRIFELVVLHGEQFPKPKPRDDTDESNESIEEDEIEEPGAGDHALDKPFEQIEAVITDGVELY